MSDNEENNTTQIIKEYEKVPNIDQLLRDCQQEVKMLEVILEESKRRYNNLKIHIRRNLYLQVSITGFVIKLNILFWINFKSQYY